MIDRVFLLQLLIDNLNVDRYLEIGVFKGDCFLQLNVPRKICVDPHIQISFWNKIKSILRDSNNQNNQYIELTSDRYFDLYHDTLVNEPPQLVFIDGLHTFEQTLQDVLNVLNYLPENGVIVLHDCSPPTEVSATVGTSLEEAEKNWLATHEGGWTGSWCGDTWKVILFLKDNYPELHVSVLDFDFGLGSCY